MPAGAPCRPPSKTSLAILDLEPLEVNLFRGRSPAGGLAARVRRPGDRPGAGRGLPHRRRRRRPPHSLHAYFLLAGDPKVPIIYEVDRIRDGKSFTTRRVVAIQHGQAIFTMAVSFHRDEPGMSHQAQMPDVPKPEELPSEAEIKERVLPLMPDPVRRYYERERPIEMRPVEFDRYLGKKHRRTAASTSGSAPPGGCPTSRRSINACWPMRPT